LIMTVQIRKIMNLTRIYWKEDQEVDDS
jgi:hypothetical protein